MTSLRTRRGTAAVEANAMTVSVHPWGHAKRVLLSWHGPVWAAVLIFLTLQAGGAYAAVVGAAILTGTAFAMFLGSVWFLRYEARLWPGTTTIQKDAVDAIAAGNGRFTVVHGQERTVVAPDDPDAFRDALADHGYPDPA